MRYYRYYTVIFAISFALSTPTHSDPIHEAAKNNDLAAIKKIISQGISINVQDEYGRTALYWAAQQGYHSLIEVLVASKSDINFVSSNDDSWTPLITSSYGGHTKTVELLVSHGADIEAEDKDGYTALSWAFKQEKYDTAKLLITRGANVNIPPASDYGPAKDKNVLILHSAVMRGAPIEFIKTVIEHGAKINAKDRKNSTPLHKAIDRGNLETVKLLTNYGADLSIEADGGIFTGMGILRYTELTPLELAKLYEKYVPGPRKNIIDFLSKR